MFPLFSFKQSSSSSDLNHSSPKIIHNILSIPYLPNTYPVLRAESVSLLSPLRSQSCYLLFEFTWTWHPGLGFWQFPCLKSTDKAVMALLALPHLRQLWWANAHYCCNTVWNPGKNVDKRYLRVWFAGEKKLSSKVSSSVTACVNPVSLITGSATH